MSWKHIGMQPAVHSIKGNDLMTKIIGYCLLMIPEFWTSTLVMIALEEDDEGGLRDGTPKINMSPGLEFIECFEYGSI